MKLLFLNNYHYLRGGSERVFFSEIEMLRANGHNVCSFARKHPRDLPSTFSYLFPEDLKTESVRFSVDALRTVKEIIYSKEAKASLRKLIDQFRPDIAHAHNIYGRLTTSVLDILREESIPTVLTLHDYKLICPSYKLMRDGRVCEECKGNNFYKTILYRCHKDSIIASVLYAFESYFNFWFKKYTGNVAHFISPSRFLKDKLVEFGYPEKKIEYLPNYLDVSKFKPSYTPGKYFLYLGRLSAEKGISTLIKAYEKVDYAHTKLMIAGEGPERNKLENMASQNPNIIFTGYMSGPRLEEASRDSLAIVIPSEWYENAPISILEAMAYGKPVIGSRIGGIPEMVDEGETGYLFKPGDIEDLASKIESFLSLPKSAIAEMGKAAREKVENFYNERIHYERLMEIYRRALSHS